MFVKHATYVMSSLEFIKGNGNIRVRTGTIDSQERGQDPGWFTCFPSQSIYY